MSVPKARPGSFIFCACGTKLFKHRHKKQCDSCKIQPKIILSKQKVPSDIDNKRRMELLELASTY